MSKILLRYSVFAWSSDIVLFCDYWLTRSDSKCHRGASLSQMSSGNLSCYKFGSRITCSLMGWGKFAQLWFVKAFQRQVGWLKKHTQPEQNEDEMECWLRGFHLMINPFTPSLKTLPGKHGMFALGVTAIVICGVLIWAGNSGGQCSTRLPERSPPTRGRFDLLPWCACISLSLIHWLLAVCARTVHTCVLICDQRPCV